MQIMQVTNNDTKSIQAFNKLEEKAKKMRNFFNLIDFNVFLYEIN